MSFSRPSLATTVLQRTANGRGKAPAQLTCKSVGLHARTSRASCHGSEARPDPPPAPCRPRLAVVACALLGLQLSPLAAAQETSDPASDTDAPAQQAYSLLHPVPTDRMRSFSTDRPTRSNVPYTVDAGHFQYETDLVNDTSLSQSHLRTDILIVPGPTLKAGLTDSTDFELSLIPYERIRSGDRRSWVTSGFGDIIARLKINLWGNNGGDSTMALIPYVKVPTARAGIGNGAVEGGLIAPLSFSLPRGFTLLLNSEVDVLKDADRGGYHPGFINLVNVSRAVLPNVTVFAELWSDVNADPGGTVTQASADLAVAWALQRSFQLDLGINLGLNRDTPGYQLYLGAAQRF